MRLLASVIIVGLVSIMHVSLAYSQDGASPGAQSFVNQAAIGNRFEIQSSELAIERSDNESILNFARMMIEDHTKAGTELKEAILEVNNVSVVRTPAEILDADHQRKLEALRNASQDSFDAHYVHIQVQAHDEAVRLFDQYAAQGTQPELRDFAAQTLPTLREHQQQIKTLANKFPNLKGE
ncbi:MAG: DUF4142 domain-containing protein [Alphaproteobacteria bacterium]|nr:DUF4142 domain-containing protein [Alphaproteobacteria bacterium]